MIHLLKGLTLANRDAFVCPECQSTDIGVESSSRELFVICSQCGLTLLMADDNDIYTSASLTFTYARSAMRNRSTSLTASRATAPFSRPE
jgi:transcription elongation factor Elf1